MPVRGVRVQWLDIGSAEKTELELENVEGFVQVAKHEPNYDVSKIQPYTLEDPLTFTNGTKVTNLAAATT